MARGIFLDILSMETHFCLGIPLFRSREGSLDLSDINAVDTGFIHLNKRTINKVDTMNAVIEYITNLSNLYIIESFLFVIHHIC